MLYIILNPGILYVLVWLTVLSLYQFQYSLLLLPITETAFFFVVASCCSFYLPTLFKSLITKKRFTKRRKLISVDFQAKTKGIFLFWLFFSVIEIIVARNLPLFGVLGLGPYVRYTDFGIPTLHGLLNACLLVLSNYSLYRYLERKSKKDIILWALFLLWGILKLGRQLIMSQFIQSTFILLYYLKDNSFDLHRLKQRIIKLNYNVTKYIIPSRNLDSTFKISKSNFYWFLRIFIGFICLVFLFDAIGNSRNVDGGLITSIGRASPEYPQFLPSGIFWIYLYITSPLSNVINNIDFIEPNYLPLNIISSLTPSAIIDILGLTTNNNYDWQLVVKFLNVNTFHASFLLDFGMYISLCVYFLMSLLFQSIYLRSLKSRLVCWRFINVVILHNIVLSIFVNFFTHIVFIAQIIIHFFLQYKKHKLK
ncbi:O-antigen polymerase [Mastigocoleus sp. MO_188.B34]|uniref:O-antigen polymerase n=1 Tax=Mastigocoleus sp. MO_188.B34 TaxID=3036635 RepID=UPI0026311330|nr:O-antigen polymerase [Mastigocoleus sp. MO_188.B34]MDJ0696542.1 O-antigen polymerase [Mastigocoleus sp. MO_188.B34]